jgi:hypothetical protein
VTMTSRDPAKVARAARLLVQSGAWRDQLGRTTREKVLLSLHGRMRWAIPLLPVDALVALTRQPPAGGCHWCVAAIERFPERELAHDDPATMALLGQPCATCRRRHAAAEVARRERGHLDQLTAAGLNPRVFPHLRTSGQVLAHAAELREWRAARAAAAAPSPAGRRRGRGPTPTGIIWAAPRGR